jgi:PD-(D/E)XK nuclease superfamily
VTALWHAAAPVSDLPPDPPEAAELAQRYRELVRYGSDTSERSRQREIGASEIGWECDRRVAYRLAGTPATNRTDPLRALMGSGTHLWLAATFARFNSRHVRFLVEYGCTYRGVTGHGDLYDIANGTVVDWKTTTAANIRAFRRGSVPPYSVVQVQHNAAALAADGWQPRAVALAYLPTDSTLDNSWVWRGEVDPALVDAAIDRVDRLRGVDPATVPARPGRHCAYCHQYNANATDLTRSCPATTNGGKQR